MNPLEPNSEPYAYIFVALWSSFVVAEQMCVAFLLIVKSRMNVAAIVTYILCISVSLASGTVRSYKGLQPWLQDNAKGTHTRYASFLLHNFVFLSRNINCTTTRNIACRDPSEYLIERMGQTPDVRDIILQAEILQIQSINCPSLCFRKISMLLHH